jgi:hypothetical protein
MGMKAVLALSVLCVLNVPSALAGPAFYVQPNAKSCVEQPHKALGGQGAAQADRLEVGHLSAPVRKLIITPQCSRLCYVRSAISIVVTSQIPGVYRVACPGGDFEVKVGVCTAADHSRISGAGPTYSSDLALVAGIISRASFGTVSHI